MTSDGSGGKAIKEALVWLASKFSTAPKSIWMPLGFYKLISANKKERKAGKGGKEEKENNLVWWIFFIKQI